MRHRAVPPVSRRKASTVPIRARLRAITAVKGPQRRKLLLVAGRYGSSSPRWRWECPKATDAAHAPAAAAVSCCTALVLVSPWRVGLCKPARCVVVCVAGECIVRIGLRQGQTLHA